MEEPHLELPASYGPAETVKVLDVALDLIDVRLARDLVKDRAASENRDIGLSRSLGAARVDPGRQRPSRFAPALSQRASPRARRDPPRSGPGYDREEGWFHELSFRLALHDRLDPAIGYPEFAAIEFLPFTLRYDVEEPRLTLQCFSAVKIQSLTADRSIDTPLAFGLDVGFERTFDEAAATAPPGSRRRRAASPCPFDGAVSTLSAKRASTRRSATRAPRRAFASDRAQRGSACA